jgi:hypothetical protein
MPVSYSGDLRCRVIAAWEAKEGEATGIRVSISAMHRAVEKLGLRCKKKVFMPVSRILHESKNYDTTIAGG